MGNFFYRWSPVLFLFALLGFIILDCNSDVFTKQEENTDKVKFTKDTISKIESMGDSLDSVIVNQFINSK